MIAAIAAMWTAALRFKSLISLRHKVFPNDRGVQMHVLTEVLLGCGAVVYVLRSARLAWRAFRQQPSPAVLVVRNVARPAEADIVRHPILDEILAHCAARGLSRSVFGEKAVGDPNFVFNLEAGREPRRTTVQRVRDFMQDVAPEQGAA